MINLNGLIYQLPKEIKLLIGAFIIVLSIGFYSGLLFVKENSSTQPNGIEEHYLGNEDIEDVKVMKFKKSKKEILTTVHNHILSMSIIFFILGFIISITQINIRLKLFLMIEPFISVILTFGGIYLMWTGLHWMKYVVMISGILMTTCFTMAVLLVLRQLTRSPILK